MAIALSGTIASAQNKTSATTLATSCLIAASVGDVIVLTSAADNEGASDPTFTVSDSQGNTWTVADEAIVGTVTRAGIAGCIAWCQVTNALTTSDAITVTLSGAGSFARSLIARSFTTGAPLTALSVVEAAGTGSTVAITSGSADSGDLVVGGAAIEDYRAPTFDTDTDNGSWGSGVNRNTSGGGDASNVCSAMQHKIVTGTGTQTWNLTLGVATERIGWVLVLHEDSGISGTLAVTEEADTLDAAGTVAPPAITGSLAVTEAADTLAASGTYTPPAVTGSLSVTETADTLSASGTATGPTNAGTLAVTEAADTLAASGTVAAPARTGTLAAAEAADTLAASGTVTPPPITGTLSATEAADTLAASGNVAGPGTISGSLAVTEADDTLAASGTVTAPAVTGTLAATEAPDTLTASGTVLGAPITGTLAVTEAPDTLSGSGVVAGPGAVTGSLAVTEAADTLVASATFTPGAITGTLSVTEEFDSLIAAGFGPGGLTVFEPVHATSVAYVVHQTTAYVIAR